MAFYNSLQGKDLKFPTKYKDKVEGYCGTKPSGGESEGPLFSPFNRQVDLWFLAFCLGVKAEKRTSSLKSYRFITGEVLINTPYMIEMIELVAISEDNDPYVVGDGAALANIANEYAATGIDILFNALKYVPTQEPLFNLVEYFTEQI